MNEHLTRYERRQLEKEAKSHEWQKKLRRAQIKKTASWIIALLVVIGALIPFGMWVASYQPYLRGPIHWHAELAYKICGRDEKIREREIGRVMEAVHAHNDGKIHMEFPGHVGSSDELKLKAFFKNADIDFSQTQVGSFTAGQTCPDKKTPGAFRLLIDGKESTEWGDHVMKDGEKILILYE